MVKRGRILAFFLIVLLVGNLMGFSTNGILKNIKLGLDLQGGFEILYDVKPINANQKVDRDLLLSTVSALNKRINVLGVSEPIIQIEGNDRIRVQLAGVQDQEKAREILSTQAKLTFRDVFDQKLLDGGDLQEGGAAQSFDDKNRPIVTLTLKDADKFGQVTQQILSMKPNNLMVIWLDFIDGVDSFAAESQKDPSQQKYLSAATVSQVLNTKNVMISGNFTIEEAKQLADLLNAGSLPVDLHEVFSTSIGASFGELALHDTIFAGLIGIALIYLFMLVYYRFLGFIAVVALSIYIWLILVVFDWMNAVLTLPGIAALILGIAMAVDANILTYERIKEEIRAGKSMMSAFRAGSKHSFRTILDANLTSIIAAVVLFYYGTSSVKGFATMLIISILVSFVTAVWGSRLLLQLWVNSRFLNNKVSWFGVKKSQIRDIHEYNEEELVVRGPLRNADFIKHHRIYFMVSGAMTVIGIIALLTMGLNLGIDFASGTRIEIQAPNHQLTKDVLTKEFDELGYKIEDITLAGNNNEMSISRFVGVLSKEEVAKVKAHFVDKYGVEPNISTVSPTVGKELAKNAFKGIMFASLGIVLYVAFRFEWYFGFATIVSLLHDAFLIITIFSILRIEVDLTFIAAVLTVVGFSVHDTIVTFDRIRENMKIKKRVKTYDDLAEIVNKSLIQVMARSINTVLTVLIASGVLWIFGAESIKNFSLALLVGLIAGAYSSIFIAAQLWLVMKAKTLGKTKTKPKDKEKDYDPEPQV
ncbi:protein translocase subunit SecDF [Schinkia azotoformans]|uniref:Multifunctional fusion protein n=1 Tax=Schinkia azotoformans LMG 9581 TaxID=1131731 RepID=K6DA12_SCHAZ|nr:protein translocase subunit SecDF [Schinkia azotoformans]EKN64933.1 bifunctional preprotein translocase subunit SecD/SecF [Schinkia azotoformans LMG 9581]MEC1640291.1 protein translocase subunit SecDF [Schinkia azotoformans]MEC1720300.1 protein translocase subunit SecDF [Schinkia azotoformans]MEC1945640.1 protein translocase subunit SecDF [Schinkia azotoformans]MED4353738.1 protein translocase subunit SecDF [Schinkia azotoformans]